MISTLIALPYELARLPLTVVDRGLADRLPETSAPRVAIDRTLGSADRIAGTLLHHRGLAERGADRLERTEKLLAAARLEQEANARREQAAETTAEGRREAAEKREAARDRAVTGLEDADVAEARGKQEAESRAAKAASTKKAAAARRAADRTASVERRKEAVDTAAERQKAATQREVKAEIDEARETRQAADQARADAERLGDLTDAKKQERTAD